MNSEHFYKESIDIVTGTRFARVHKGITAEREVSSPSLTDSESSDRICSGQHGEVVCIAVMMEGFY